ncbi:hypothetical protein E1292_47605 [Nonomuraea deserti]|uniref:Uncharacterized protein n=1 Tax=Nonomuraea deserti TaxID=1848322 RepID=A0A4R4UES2_9ACTN|nr:acetamidase/formamidase family protein [Nonomuraea deserti]TDC86683.1 hypothetical protein E1292_47605 [Nonomuraea deserti]
MAAESPACSSGSSTESKIRISCIVTIPNPTVTLYLPIDIFDRDILPR